MNTNEAQKKDMWLLWTLITVYVGAFFTSCVLRFNAFNYYDMDLAAYDQIVWNILNGSLYSSILGLNFLGHHAHFLAFPVAVIYKVFPHPLTLLFLQTLALGLGAHPLYMIARKVLDSRWALLVAIVYLLYPSLGYTNFYEFHFPSFATATILYAMYFFVYQRYVKFILAIILTLLCQENMSLLVVGFGFYALILKRPLKWWLPLVIGGGLYFIFCAKILFPILNKDVVQFMSIYKFWGNSYGEILENLITHPVEAICYIASEKHLIWLMKLFLPLLLIPLIAPIHLFAAIPLFLQHLLSNRSQETNIHFHYAAELIPFIFLSFIFGLRKLLNINFIHNQKSKLWFLILVFSFEGMYILGPHLTLFEKSVVRKDSLDVANESLLALVPPNAALVTTFEFMPRVTHREKLYSFHHIYWGHFTLSDKPYTLPSAIDYALIDFNDGLTFNSFYQLDRYKNIQNFLSEQKLSPVVVRNNTVLFERNSNKKEVLFNSSETALVADGKVDLFSDGNVILKDFKLSKDGDRVDVKFFWYAKKATQNDIVLWFNFIDAKGGLVYKLLSPVCYRIYPSQAWSAGEWVMDHKLLTIPKKLRDQSFSIETTFYNWVTGQKINDKVLHLK